MSSLDNVFRSRTDMQSLYPIARIISWEALSQEHDVLFAHPETSLSVVELQNGSAGARLVMAEVIKSWERISESIGQNFLPFHDYHKIAQLTEWMFEPGFYPDHLHLAICGNQQHGIQGIMGWSLDRNSLSLHCLMTSPLNILSPYANPALRVKRVGETCIRYLQQFCEQSDCETISLMPSRNAIPFYQRHGFTPGQEIPADRIVEMNWTRAPSPIALKSD